MSHTLSMSKVHLALVCAHSFRDGVKVTPRTSGVAARKGTAMHLIVECWFHGREIPTLPDPLPEKEASEAKRMAEQAIAWLTPRRSRILECERGIRYNAESDTAEWGPRRGEPGYGDVDGVTLPGTLDIVLRGEDGVLENLDLKSGQKANMHEEQIRAQGLAIARKYGEKHVRVGFLRPLLTRCDEPEWIPMTENDLDEQAGELYGLMRRIPTSEPVHGEHCNRCDYRGACPAWVGQRSEEQMHALEEAGAFG